MLMKGAPQPAGHVLLVVPPRDPRGERVHRGADGDRLTRQERVLALRLTSPPQPPGQDPVDRDVHLLQRVGGGHRPVAAERDPGATGELN